MIQSECASLISTFLEKPGIARNALIAGAALFDMGEQELAVALWTLGDDANGLVRRIKDNPAARAEGRQRSQLADFELCRFLTDLHRQAVDSFEAKSGARVDRVRNAVWPLTHSEQGEYLTPLQRPVFFYMPDLPANPVESNDAFDWISVLETATETIRQEYAASVDNGADVRPYVPTETHAQEWEQLRGSLDWSAIHLYQDAKATPMLERFPNTAKVLTAVDLARIDGVPMEVFFSRLRPGAHIPPHCGLTNSRVTVHLPLIVPHDCEIRIGRDLHQWTTGRIFAFDDSFEHEAWNRSDSDRVVLIFETHHPDLSMLERAAIEHVFTVRQRWLDGRRTMVDEWMAKAGAQAAR